MKLLCSLICIGLVAGLRTPVQLSQTLHKRTNQQSSVETGNKQPPTGNYRGTANNHQSTAGTSQPIADPQQSFSFYNSNNLPDQVFLCNDGKFRIYSFDKCDGKIDCPDGSDEFPELCLTSSPPPINKKCNNQGFQCPSGKCISKFLNIMLSEKDCWGSGNSSEANIIEYCTAPMLLCDNSTQCVSYENRCNGVPDCLDKTDEVVSGWNQTTSGSIVRCANGQCISEHALCDGVNDCGDYSDENTCNSHKDTTKKPKHHHCSGHICPSGTCIYSSQVCDGIEDCEDNSDETSCDDNTSIWTNNKGLIISISVLGGTVCIIIVVVFVVTICYRRKYKALQTQINNMDNEPPPYWQVVGVAPFDSAVGEQKIQSHDNLF